MNNEIHILGPHYICIVYDPQTNKQIYLFGEHHRKINKDPAITFFPEYIDQVFKKHTDKTFDFFLEASYHRDKHPAKPGKPNSISGTMQYFAPYFYQLTHTLDHTKSWDNVRFHSVDIRNYMHHQELSNDETNDFIILTSLFYDVFKEKEGINRLKPNQIDFIKRYIFDETSNILYDDKILLDNRWKIAESCPKIQRNIKNIHDKLKEHYQDELLTFINKDKCSVVSDIFSKLIRNNHINDKDHNIKIIWNFLTKYSIFFMDIYLLGRMYKSFQPKSADNVIVLTGVNHTKNLINYFKKTNCKIIYQYENYWKRVVKLPNEMFPLFDNNTPSRI